jgi:NAD(P)-dependent dehydrogenase (short-subunit alcohol dehydrogenase family)
MIGFTRQVAIVTSAGHGLGRLCALDLARRGHHNYSACSGRFGRVFVGLSDGWFADTDEDPSAEDIAAHRTEHSAIEPFTVPMTVFEEIFGVRGRLGVST